MKTDLYTSILVADIVYFSSANSIYGCNGKRPLDFVRFDTEVSCGLVLVCANNVAVLFL